MPLLGNHKYGSNLIYHSWHFQLKQLDISNPNINMEDWKLDHRYEEAGRKEQSSSTFDLQWHVSRAHDHHELLHVAVLSSAWLWIAVFITPLHFHPDDDWNIQSKHQLVIFQARVGNITFSSFGHFQSNLNYCFWTQDNFALHHYTYWQVGTIARLG